MIFFHASTQIFLNLRHVINRFSLVSGPMSNCSKSFIKFSPIILEFSRQEIISCFNYRQVSAFPHHLGAPLDLQGSKKRHFFRFFWIKIASKSPQWVALKLSQAPKLVLINTVVVDMIAYVISCYELPVSTTFAIDAMIDNKVLVG